MKCKFSKGDRVIYVSGRHSTGRNNPLAGTTYACEGEIYSLSKRYGSSASITVFWDNGTRNSYSEGDLTLIMGGEGHLNPNLSFRIKQHERKRRT